MTGQAMRVAARAGAGVTWRRWWPWLLVLGAALLPVLAAQVPPLLDYHNHLARQYILARADGSDALAQWYRTSWHAAPYLAFDGIVQASRFAERVASDLSHWYSIGYPRPETSEASVSATATRSDRPAPSSKRRSTESTR